MYAKWQFTYFALREINSNELCQDIKAEGIAFTTEWTLCNSQVALDDYVLNLYFYNGPEFNFRDGTFKI